MDGHAVNPIVVDLIAEYLDAPEGIAHGLLIHLRINGWQITPIPVKERTFAEPEGEDASR